MIVLRTDKEKTALNTYASSSCLFNNAIKSSIFLHEANGGNIFCNFQRCIRDTQTLAIYFRGAVAPTRRDKPEFLPFQTGISSIAHQISISDPSLDAIPDPSLGIAWYCGHQGFDAQTEIFYAIKEFVDILNVTNIVFFSGSSGGYAALYFASKFENSSVIVTNAHTNVERYYSGHVSRYLRICWPDFDSLDDIKNHSTLSVIPTYSKKINFPVIYLQSSADTFHLFNHMMPFIKVFDLESGGRFLIPIINFWGKIGHSGSVPFSYYNLWLKCLVMNPAADRNKLFEVFSYLGNCFGDKKEMNQEVFESQVWIPEFKDIRCAELLRDFELRS